MSILNKLIFSLAALFLAMSSANATVDFNVGSVVGANNGDTVVIPVDLVIAGADAGTVTAAVLTVAYDTTKVTLTNPAATAVAYSGAYSPVATKITSVATAGSIDTLTIQFLDLVGGTLNPLPSGAVGTISFDVVSGALSEVIPLVATSAARDAANAVVASTPNDGSITMAGPGPVVMSITATDAAASEGGDTGAFELSCTGGDGVTAVPVAVTLGPAPGADYAVAPPFPATIVCPGTAPAVIVTPVDNALVDGDRTVVATIGLDPANFSIGTGSATVTISDDDIAPTVTITANDADAEDKDGNLDDGQFTLTCTAGNVATVDVILNVSGAAAPGVDYNVIATPATVACPGTTLIDVIVIDDGEDDELAERVSIALGAGAAYTLGASSSAFVTIVGNLTQPRVIPTLSTWAMMLMALFLMFIAVPMVRTRQS